MFRRNSLLTLVLNGQSGTWPGPGAGLWRPQPTAAERQQRDTERRSVLYPFFLLTVVFVMLAEVLIFLPSIARFRYDFMAERLKLAQVAALTQLAAEDMVSPELQAELLANAEVFNVVLRRNEVRELVLSMPMPSEVYASFDLRTTSPFGLIRDALSVFADPTNRVVRVIGNPVQDAGTQIEITMETRALRAAMLDYGFRILLLSALISGLTALLLFFSVQRLLVVPIRRVVSHVKAYAEAPEDARRVIEPSASIDELRIAEEALQSLQTQLTGALRQKERLAQMGGAVAKISHDLRNILTTAQLFADRMENSADPAVARAAPKLIGSISRAVSLCETTLAFGRAEEAPPQMKRLSLRALVEEVVEGEAMSDAGPIACLVDIPPGLVIRADGEQLFRVLANLARNARQAIEATGKDGTVEISAGETDEDWWIRVGDTGPGLPAKAREHLFTAFQGGTRKGGSGLGLAIAAELVRGHGGRLDLARSDADGTEFVIHLPKAADPAEA
jgi:signal transduction histidine kinase